MLAPDRAGSASRRARARAGWPFGPKPCTWRRSWIAPGVEWGAAAVQPAVGGIERGCGRVAGGAKWGGFARVRVFSKKLLRLRGVPFWVSLRGGWGGVVHRPGLTGRPLVCSPGEAKEQRGSEDLYSSHSCSPTGRGRKSGRLVADEGRYARGATRGGPVAWGASPYTRLRRPSIQVAPIP